MNFEKKLEEHIKEICKEFAVKFIEASIHGHKNKQNIKVIVDTENGISLQECQKLSREISDIIFRKDLIYSDYRLDVSSPGSDKPLKYDYEFKRNIGRELIVNYKDESGNLREVIGELTAFENDEILFKENKESYKIKLSNIIKAKIKLKW